MSNTWRSYPMPCEILQNFISVIFLRIEITNKLVLVFTIRHLFQDCWNDESLDKAWNNKFWTAKTPGVCFPVFYKSSIFLVHTKSTFCYYNNKYWIYFSQIERLNTKKGVLNLFRIALYIHYMYFFFVIWHWILELFSLSTLVSFTS